MICRHFKEGQKLNVADLNEITVLIDRSETELTEVALNSWTPGLDGPPHFHEQKEQVFFITQGTGHVTIGEATYPAAVGDLFYVPAGVIHQTRTGGGVPLEYLLFNAFLNADKEGHGSFADHIEKVKATRKLQAETQQAAVAATHPSPVPGSKAAGRRCPAIGGRPSGWSQQVLLPRSCTDRCEVVALSWPASAGGPRKAESCAEQTLFVLDGGGKVTVGQDSQPVKQGDVIFVPRNTTLAVQAGSEGLGILALSTIVC